MIKLWLLLLTFQAFGEARIATFSPAAVEMVRYLGLENQIVAHVKFSNIQNKNSVLVGDYLNFNKELLIKLKPNYAILTKTSTRAELNTFLSKIGAKIIEIDPKNLNDLKKEFEILSKEFQVKNPSLPELNCASWKKICEGDNFLIVIQRNPLMVMGDETFLSSLFQACGYKNEAHVASYARINQEDVLHKKIDLVIDMAYDQKSSLKMGQVKCQRHVEDSRASLPGIPQLVWFNEARP